MNHAKRLYDGATGQIFNEAIGISPALGLPALTLTTRVMPLLNRVDTEHDHCLLAGSLRMEHARYGKNTHDHVLLALAVNVALEAASAISPQHPFHTVYTDLARSSFPILATQAPHRAMKILEQRLTESAADDTRPLMLDVFADNALFLMRAEQQHPHNPVTAGVPARALTLLEQLAAHPNKVPQEQRAHLLAELDKAENPMLAVPQDIMAEAQLVMAKWHDQPHESRIQQRLIGAWLYTAQMLANPKDRLGIKDKSADTAASDRAKLQRMATGAIRVGNNSPSIMAFLQQHDLLPKAPDTTIKPPELVGPVAHTEVVGPHKPAPQRSTKPFVAPAVVRTWPVATTALKPVYA